MGIKMILGFMLLFVALFLVACSNPPSPSYPYSATEYTRALSTPPVPCTDVPTELCPAPGMLVQVWHGNEPVDSMYRCMTKADIDLQANQRNSVNGKDQYGNDDYDMSKLYLFWCQ